MFSSVLNRLLGEIASGSIRKRSRIQGGRMEGKERARMVRKGGMIGGRDGE